MIAHSTAACHITRVPLIILLLALGLRAYRLDAQSLWYDEGLSVHLASLPLTETIAQSAVTDHPPLHAVILNLWMGIAGSGEFSVRFVSVFFGTLVIALTHALGRRLGGARVGALAAGLIAIAPMAVWYGQEARGYSLLVAWVLFAILAYLRLESGDSRARVWLAYVLVSAAALYTHYFAAFPIVAVNFAFMLNWVRKQAAPGAQRAARATRYAISIWLMAQLSIVALFLPWLPNALAQAASNATYFPGRVTWDTVVLQTWRSFAGGDFPHLGQPAMPPPTSVMWLALILLGAVSPFVARRLSSQPGAPYANRAKGVLLTISLLVVPLLLMSMLAWEKPKFAPRYLLPSLPAFVVLAGLGIDRLLRFRNSLLAALVLLPVLLIPAVDLLVTSQIYFDPPAARPDVRAVAAYIDTNEQAGDAILLVGGHQAPVFEYYYRGPSQVIPLPPDLLPAAQAPLDVRVLSQLADVASTQPRAWLVLWQQSIADPTGLVLGELRTQARRLEVGQTFHEMSLLLFDLRDAAFEVAPQHRLDASFADPVRLAGFDINSYQFESGQELLFALYFESSGPIARNYQVFAHLIGPGGSIEAQADSIAGADSYPTSLWADGTHMRNRFSIRLPADLSAGTYRLLVGLYDESGRLALAGGGDATEIAAITIEP
jgi:4-amino-4-deoxy-L-arabinose transferase-like glycosyltransferase